MPRQSSKEHAARCSPWCDRGRMCGSTRGIATSNHGERWRAGRSGAGFGSRCLQLCSILSPARDSLVLELGERARPRNGALAECRAVMRSNRRRRWRGRGARARLSPHDRIKTDSGVIDDRARRGESAETPHSCAKTRGYASRWRLTIGLTKSRSHQDRQEACPHGRARQPRRIVTAHAGRRRSPRTLRRPDHASRHIRRISLSTRQRCPSGSRRTARVARQARVPSRAVLRIRHAITTHSGHERWCCTASRPAVAVRARAEPTLHWRVRPVPGDEPCAGEGGDLE
jgi:hypothetical protein